MWDPQRYLQFAAERRRPFDDLLARIPSIRVGTAVDLGCGPGTLTRVLAEKWPAARIMAVDASCAMLNQAVENRSSERIEFVVGDMAQWQPAGPIDLVVSNAALHWLANHEAILTRWTSWLTPGGVLAVQVPNRFHTPMQDAIEAVSAMAPWAERLRGVGLQRDSVLPVSRYARLLLDLGLDVDAWETNYVHVLTGESPAVDWLLGTGLRPLVARLAPEEVNQFLDELAVRLRAAYPPLGGVTLLEMPRLFFVAQRR